jgi:hypothetical protein
MKGTLLNDWKSLERTKTLRNRFRLDVNLRIRLVAPGRRQEAGRLGHVTFSGVLYGDRPACGTHKLTLAVSALNAQH